MMELTTLKERQDLAADSKSGRAYIQLEILLRELSKKALPDNIVVAINVMVNEINANPATGNDLVKALRQQQSKITKLLEKELKIVPKNYYRNFWLAAGMAAFGLPIGVIFGMSIGNMGLMAIGLPIGMAIGTAVGTGMDKKAADEGRQLDVEIK